MTVDDGARLYVDGQLIIDKWLVQPATTYTADVPLSAGDHEIKLEYFEATVGATASLSWAAVGGASCLANVPTNRWRGEYFNNINLTGGVAMARDDGDGFLSFDFSAGSPNSACGLGVDNFSARWTRTVNFSQGIYRFSVTVDDGARLYVDGQLIIDKWLVQGVTTYTADVPLSAGDHEIRLEYFEAGGNSLVALSWAAVSGASCLANVPTHRWRGEYFNNITLTGGVAMVRDDGDGFLNFDFGVSSPGESCGVGVDNFSARWTRTVNFATAGIYRFLVTVDDGARLYVDGQLIIDKWLVQPATTYTADVPLSAGDHEIKLEYFEATVGATASLSWISLSGASADLNMALIDPTNRIGSTGKDLLSRNSNWSLPLLALPGRAGMDLGLVLSLNSLIYTRAGAVIHIDPDQGYPAPGFKLGFPEIRNAFINTEAGTQSYLLSMPSGSRVEFRQINTNVYEAVDSSYMLLTHDPINSVFILYTTDGTQLRFEDVTGLGDHKCKQIKDRQGNYITIDYGSLAQIEAITDTLGREIIFNYDEFNHLNSITQNWSGQTHTWATFAYGTQTIQTNFPGLTLNGTTNGTQESVLTRIGLADGSVYSFEYNTYAQVKTIRRYAPNNSNPVNFPGDYFQRSYTTYGLPDTGANPQMDCPRATSRTDWAHDWNAGVTVVYATDPGRAWGQVTFPDGTIYKEFFATSGWRRGLTTQTENWAGGEKKKWTTIEWTQDNIGISYRHNPRVTETNVYDNANNRRRTTVNYTSFGLPSDVYEYDADATTVLRRTHTGYNLSAAYTSRRIIGLPNERTLYDGNNTRFSKVTYEYDHNPDPYLQHQGPVVQHDTANYGASFVQGRGNLNAVRRWDVTDPDESSKCSIPTMGYNTSGSVIFTRDAAGHQTDIIYTDSFSDGQNRNTYAYPTRTTDPDDFESTVQYNYNFGAATRAQNPKGAAVARIYDAVGRIERVRNEVNQAYTRYVYAPNQTNVQSFTTINDLNPANEFFSITVFDGHGRARATASDHPTSVGQYKAQYMLYDMMGRLAQQSNPTEINGSWQPAGDDATGWVWSYQDYDWQGRPTVSTDQEGNTTEALYGGCGCAGGQVVVTRDEVGRRQKMTYDVLGRLRTAQALFVQPKNQPLDGSGVVYSTTTNTYNVRDQVINVNVRDDASAVSQNTQMVYDGHGRLKERWLPIYLGNPQSETPYDSYEYHGDDTLMKVTDPRGASATYGYNNRHLVTSIVYGVPGGVAETSNVTFGYDEAGNRTWMDDGPGYISYAYGTLSRMESETRTFNLYPGSYKLAYEYNLAGQMKRIGYESTSYPADNNIVYYDYNKAGEMIAVTGSPLLGVTQQYQTGMTFRAWGGLKSASYGSGATLSASYTARQQFQQFEITMPVGGAFMKSQYSYYDDGRIKYAKDFVDDKFDRAYSYDQVGRMQEAYSGTQARDLINQTNTTPVSAPYRQTYQYDVWSNLTSNNGNFWGENYNFSDNYNNGRRQGWGYDQAGNLTNDGQNILGYDAASRNLSVETIFSGTGHFQGVDGDGVVVAYSGNLYLRSSVLGGQVIAELTGLFPIGSFLRGEKINGYVYAGGVEVARQQYAPNTGVYSVLWSHANPVTGTLASAVIGHASRYKEPDPSGGNVGLTPWSENPPTPSSPDMTILIGESGGGGLQSPKTLMDEVEVPWQLAASFVRQGVAVVGPTETWRVNNGSLERIKVNPDGSLYWDTVTGGGVKIKDRDGNVIDSISPGPHQIWNNRGGNALFGEYLSYLDRFNVFKKTELPRADGMTWCELRDLVIPKFEPEKWEEGLDLNTSAGFLEYSRRRAADGDLPLFIGGMAGKGINWSWKSFPTFGHTFTVHGAGSKMTRSLIGRAARTGEAQGQWLNNKEAATFLKELYEKLPVKGPFSTRIPAGLGQVILPGGGGIVPANGALIVPKGPGGLIKTAYPIVCEP